MFLDRPLAPQTITDDTHRVLGVVLHTGQQVPAAPSNFSRAIRYWDDVLQRFVLSGPVFWDGAKPDQHGGYTRGELLAVVDAKQEASWRLIAAPIRVNARGFAMGGAE